MDKDVFIRLNNNARHVKEDWWSWSVWLDGTDYALEQVVSVRYTLHPTFPNPVRVVTDRGTRFKLRAEGWGEFKIHALVTTKDGKSFPLERWINLSESSENEPNKASSERRPRLFISSSSIERAIVNQLNGYLEAQGVEVLSAGNLKAGDSWLECTKEAIQSADVVAIVTSGELRPFAEEELMQALGYKKPVVPILVGPNTKMPSQFGNIQAVNIKSTDQLTAVADLLAARTKEAFYG